ncbi:WhiB family transcriptional regulator [Streptomyces sp. NPDC008222]|uniref:WhiB family transcriptional regulator n=1 Tax=Streptomyces sp. NPDC008222 TaxID=3364820 RepID=UPI0036E5EC9D
MRPEADEREGRTSGPDPRNSAAGRQGARRSLALCFHCFSTQGRKMDKENRVPLGEFWEWQCRAACRGMDSSAFFSPYGERGNKKREREWAAKRVCERCPVQSDCAQFAISTGEIYGVWGGLTESQREPRRP